MGKRTRTRRRVCGDSVITSTVTVEPREVPWELIREQCRVEPDPDMGKPWEEQDGYDHRLHENAGGGDHLRRGFLDDRRGYVMATKGSGVYAYLRGLGLSKQVCREMEALARRQALDQLVKWYSDGWEWYGVVCEFRVTPGEGKEYHSSLWGIQDDEGYYLFRVADDLADEVAGELERDGYVVTGRPDWKARDRADKRYRLRHNLTLGCWID